jgi:hypothetical protein
MATGDMLQHVDAMRRTVLASPAMTAPAGLVACLFVMYPSQQRFVQRDVIVVQWP